MPENPTADSSLIDRILSLGHAFRASKAVLSATELGVFTALAEGPLDRDHLITKLGKVRPWQYVMCHDFPIAIFIGYSA